MKDDPSLSDSEDAALKPGHVWITRRRWDAYFLSAALVIALSKALMVPSTGKTTIIATFVPLAAMWAFIRWSWPRGGAAEPTLSANPAVIPLLWWLTTWGLLIGVGGIILLDVIVPLPEKEWSWDVRSAILWTGFAICWFAGLLIGAALIERRYSRKPSASDGRLLE
jgi:hypothetical protein